MCWCWHWCNDACMHAQCKKEQERKAWTQDSSKNWAYPCPQTSLLLMLASSPVVGLVKQACNMLLPSVNMLGFSCCLAPNPPLCQSLVVEGTYVLAIDEYPAGISQHHVFWHFWVEAPKGTFNTTARWSLSIINRWLCTLSLIGFFDQFRNHNSYYGSH